MVAVIADVLKANLSGLTWIDRFGGLVSPATRVVFAQGPTGAQVVTGRQVYPIACDVNAENCWENGKFKHFEPDSTKAAICFFTDAGGTQVREITGPKRNVLRMGFQLRFLCWLNLRLIEETMKTVGGGTASGVLCPYAIGRLWGQHSAADVYGVESTEAAIYRNIEVTNIRELEKQSSMFEPFTFASDGANRGLFLYPYDFFGLQIEGQFNLHLNCLPEIEAVLTEAECIEP